MRQMWTGRNGLIAETVHSTQCECVLFHKYYSRIFMSSSLIQSDSTQQFFVKHTVERKGIELQLLFSVPVKGRLIYSFLHSSDIRMCECINIAKLSQHMSSIWANTFLDAEKAHCMHAQVGLPAAHAKRAPFSALKLKVNRFLLEQKVYNIF